VKLARHVQVAGLPLDTCLKLCKAPVDANSSAELSFMRTVALQLAACRPVRLPLRRGAGHPAVTYPRASTPPQLSDLESMHNVFDVYLWLAARFTAEAFPQRHEVAQHRVAVAVAIHESLLQLASQRALRHTQRSAHAALPALEVAPELAGLQRETFLDLVANARSRAARREARRRSHG
jgi:hypothetical protein